MAARFIKNIYALFHRQSPAKKNKSHISRTINRVFGEWATKDDDLPPPPYIESLPDESKAGFRSGTDERQQSTPPPPFTAIPRLQICPHESLSFADLQQIATSLTAHHHHSTNNGTIVSLSSNEHRSQSGGVIAKDMMIKKHRCISSPGLLRGSGNYTFVEDEGTSKDQDDNPSPTTPRGVLLSFHWDLGDPAAMRVQLDSAAELKRFLAKDVIALCPHRSICDDDVVNSIYSFVSKPSRLDEVLSCGCCDWCRTEINVEVSGEGDSCRVSTRRYLGMAEREDDPIWLAQCGAL